MGAGILFAADSLKALENTTPFHSFTIEDYMEWKDKRMYDPRPLQSYEPVGYFDMGTATKIIDKVAVKSPCKYVKLVPTSFKKTPNNMFPQDRFLTYPIELKFFGVIGEEIDSILEADSTPDSVTPKSDIQKLLNTG